MGKSGEIRRKMGKYGVGGNVGKYSGNEVWGKSAVEYEKSVLEYEEDAVESWGKRAGI